MGVTFTSEAAKRIASAVRKVERTPQDRVGDRIGSDPGEDSFWAWITGCDLSGKRYSWVRVYPDFDSDSPDLIVDSAMKWRIWGGSSPLTGWENAYSANGERGINDKIVRLHFAGYRRDDEVPVYVFTHEQPTTEGGMGLHDHRDNYNGGFAFATYHPGTSLPQQKWF